MSMHKGRAKRRSRRRERTVQLLKHDPGKWVELGESPTVSVRITARTFRPGRSRHWVTWSGRCPTMRVSTGELCATRDEVDRAVALSVLGARVGDARFYEGSRLRAADRQTSLQLPELSRLL